MPPISRVGPGDIKNSGNGIKKSKQPLLRVILKIGDFRKKFESL